MKSDDGYLFIYFFKVKSIDTFFKLFEAAVFGKQEMYLF